MIETVFRSDDLRPADRLACFDDFQVNSPHPMRVTSEIPEKFSATARALDLAAVNVVELTCSPLGVHRTPRQVRDFDPELCSILFPLTGRLGVMQAGGEATLNAQEFALYDSRHPFTVRTAADDETATLVRAQFPRTLLPMPSDQIDRLLAVPMSGKDGVGALLVQFFTRLTTDAASYRTGDLPRLSGIAVDLMSAAIAHHLDSDTETPPDVRHLALSRRIEAFIQRHLHDPELSPRAIAAAHHISVSYLHRVFQRNDTTVSAWIRRQRLEHARRDLGDPAQRTLPVHRIASRWGFNDHSTFTRAFRTAYGVPPNDYRDRSLESAGR
jgi:AraC-like DNA-binding protein